MARTAPKKRTPARPATKAIPASNKPTTSPEVPQNSDGTGIPMNQIGQDGELKQPENTNTDQRKEGENSDGTGFRIENATGIHEKDARNNPVLNTRQLNTEDLPSPEARDVNFVNRGGQIQRADNSLIEAEPVHGNDDLSARLAFLEEYVTINIAEGGDKQSELYVQLSVNGEGPGPNGLDYVPRGVDVKIKRKFLSVLASARRVRYKSVDYTEADGTRGTTQQAMSNDQYPFSVVEDSAKGHAWLKALRQSRR